VLDEGNSPDDTIDADPAACHGVIYIGGETEYAPTDFTALRWRTVGAANVGTVLQAVSNVILEVSACRNNVSDQAEAIASELAGKVESG
jgi:hypothetical protein